MRPALLSLWLEALWRGEFFGKAVSLIVPTKQVRGKRRENHHFLIRLVKCKKKKKLGFFASTQGSEQGLEPWTSLYSMSRVLQPIRGVWSSGASLISPAVTPEHHFADTFFFQTAQSLLPLKKCFDRKALSSWRLLGEIQLKYRKSWGHRCTRLFGHVPFLSSSEGTEWNSVSDWL